eukprot:scaffold85072_cov51-Attheya_sp.AAC.1
MTLVAAASTSSIAAVATLSAADPEENVTSAKVNEAAEGMVALLGDQKKNVSSDSSDKHTTSDVDSVVPASPPVLDITFTNPEENFGGLSLSEITNEDRAIFSILKPVTLEHGYTNIEHLHDAVEPLHFKYFHNDLKHLFATPLDWLLLMVSLSKDHNRQEEFQEVIDIFALVEATAIKYFRDTAVCRKQWHYRTHGPYNYVQSLCFLLHTLRPEHAFELAAYPSIQRFQVKRPTRSDPTHVRVTKFDELNDSDNESSSSNVLVTSSVYPFHQDLVTCCKTLLKGSEESNQSMVALEIEPCSSLDFSKFLDPDLDREVLCDFQQCVEDETKNSKHRYFEIGYCSSAMLPESQTLLLSKHKRFCLNVSNRAIIRKSRSY